MKPTFHLMVFLLSMFLGYFGAREVKLQWEVVDVSVNPAPVVVDCDLELRAIGRLGEELDAAREEQGRLRRLIRSYGLDPQGLPYECPMDKPNVLLPPLEAK